MKYTNRTICTEFARKDRERTTYGATGGGTLYFRGTRLYSYGPHYELAELDHDTNTARVNSRRYSQTTSCHRSVAISALIRAGWTIVDVER